MGLEDIAGFIDSRFPPAGGPLQIPSTNPRVFGQPFRTENGFLVTVENPESGSSAQAFPPQVIRWVEDAFRAVGFDIARLWCLASLWLGDVDNSGEVKEPNFIIRPITAAEIPHFGEDFAYVNREAHHSLGLQFERYDLHIWDGLAAAVPPYGGRRFFMETVHHALGHLVGSMLAVGDDPFKRKRICEALCEDRIRAEYRGGETWGYGFAWQMWDDTWQGAARNTRWALLPQERFAEAFKDIWCDPATHTFVNRTRAPRIDAQAVIDEGQVFLPVNGVDLPPHPGGGFGWRGFSMSARFVTPKSLQAGCFDTGPGINHVCFDPMTGEGPFRCVGCHPDANPNLDGFCGSSFSYPLSPDNMDITWSMRIKIPRIGFCRTSRVTYGQPLAFPDIRTRAFHCPGVPGVGADYIGASFGPDKPQNNRIDAQVVDGTYLNFTVVRGSLVKVDGMPGDTRQLYAWGTTNLSATFDCHVEPGTTFAGIGADTFRVEVTGWSALNQAMIREPDSFNFMADPFYVAQGYHHFPGLECRHRAPSLGLTFQPYRQLNLDGVSQGGARAPVSAGKEGPAVNLDYKGFVTVGQGPSLTLEGT